MGFMDMSGFCSTFHHVLAMDENLDTSSLETEVVVALELLDVDVEVDEEDCEDEKARTVTTS